MFTTIALEAANGSYMIAEGGDGWPVCAIPNEIGSWETFRLFNRTRPGEEPRHGDSVVLQAWHGRFLSAVGGGGGALNAALRWLEASTTFTIERVAGAGAIRSGEQVALRAANGNYVVAEGGGGGDVNANRPARSLWETFTIKIFRPQLVRLRAANNRYVTAEEGGGAQVTANREGVGLWETFSLHNLSRSERAVQSGDTVALQVWNGKFIQVSGALSTEVLANVNRATRAAQFTIRASGDGEIRPGQRVSLQSQATSRYLEAPDGRLVADGSLGGVSNMFFTIEFAEQAGIDFQWVPDGTALASRPFETTPIAVTGEKSLLVLYYHNNVSPPILASTEQVTEAIFGRPPSLASWLQTMSAGAFGVTNAGVYGSIQIPDATPDVIDPGMSAILTAIEEAGVPLNSFSRDRVFDTSRVQLVELGRYDAGSQNRDRAGTSRGGISFAGIVPWVHVSPYIDEGSRMVICHELAHRLLDSVDRYGFRRPIRGDVIADRISAGSHSQFIIERAAGTGAIRSGDSVMLRAYDGKYLAVGSSPPNLVPDLINTEDSSAGPARVFTIAKLFGEGEISNGAQVSFRSSAGRFMTAELGGNSSLTANRSYVDDWERFQITKVGGTGTLVSGDTVTLKSSGGYFIAADTDARDQPDENSRRRGYVWDDLAGHGEGGSFDIMDACYTAVMLSLFDRIRLGWVRPRYLTPDNRGCYLIRPFLDSRDALILYDPQNPGEWYTVENRQRREDVDEVPSSGVVISWVCQNEDYWRSWFDFAGDANWDLYHTRYPVVISAAALTVPPNSMARPVIFNVNELNRRNDTNAAFTNQEVVLPLGNGDPSRFHLSFHPVAGSENVVMCIR